MTGGQKMKIVRGTKTMYTEKVKEFVLSDSRISESFTRKESDFVKRISKCTNLKISEESSLWWMGVYGRNC